MTYYVPDRKNEDISEILSDIDKWGRRLKLKTNYNNPVQKQQRHRDNTNNVWHIENSKWTPNGWIGFNLVLKCPYHFFSLFFKDFKQI